MHIAMIADTRGLSAYVDRGDPPHTVEADAAHALADWTAPGRA